MKPGQIGIVIRCLNAPENIGAIRRVERAAGNWGWTGWKLEEPLPNGDDCITDDCMRPLNDPGDDAVDTLSVRKPAERDVTLSPKRQLENC